MFKNKKCSAFEEMLMWTSYRYCIGRHTYVVDMAYEIARNYYDRLSDERLEFTANDIRREIGDHIGFGDVNIHINRTYNSDSCDVLGPLLRFCQRQNVKKYEDLLKYADIEYDVNSDEYNWNICNKPHPLGISRMDIDDLIPWDDLAKCFDKKSHKKLILIDGTEVEAFKSWKRKTYPCEDRPGYLIGADFEWEEVWVSVNDFVSGLHNRFIPEENVKSVDGI